MSKHHANIKAKSLFAFRHFQLSSVGWWVPGKENYNFGASVKVVLRKKSGDYRFREINYGLRILLAVEGGL